MYLLNDRDDMQKAAAQIDTIPILANILMHSNELESMYPAHSVLVKEVGPSFWYPLLEYALNVAVACPVGLGGRVVATGRFEKGSD